ncbi:MAG: cell division protein FtsH, partial [Coriobacteriaceae bacterium]|nr:cell division protein FtsH [Coriobacteriaceae bacterium]
MSNMLFPQIRNAQITTVEYSTFLSDVEDDKVEEVELNTGTNTIRYTQKDDAESHIYETTLFPTDTQLVPVLREHDVKFSASIPNQSNDLWLYMLISYGLPLLIFLGGGWLINRRLRKQMGDDNSMNFGGGGFGGFGMGGLGKSNAKMVKGEETGVTFKDVAGQDEAKDSLVEIV